MQEDTKILFEKLHPLERKVLPLIKNNTTIEFLEEKTKLQQIEIIRALQWLENKKTITMKEELKELISAGNNAKTYIKTLLPEIRFLKEIEKNKKSAEEIKTAGKINEAELSFCIGFLRRKNAIDVSKDQKTNQLIITITEVGKKLLQKPFYDQLFINTLAEPRDTATLTLDEEESIKELKQRKEMIIIELKKTKIISLTELGKKLQKMDFTKELTEKVTQDMLKNNTWRNTQFRRYDVEINVPKINGGKRHFENQAIEYMKQIWLDLGFQEMTGNYVHTAYSDLDMLFVPQDHPARTMQDTFYLGEKNIIKGKLPKDFKKIKDVHEFGGTTGSKGWNNQWSEEEASKVLLRTHTTVLSALKLQQLTKKDLPIKLFNIGKVFRNEALDWKHLFEFYQVDGIVIDPNANFKDLKGYLRTFFGKMGYPDVRIRPAHFPYTEPSVEVDVLHPIKKEWIELGGAGIFRPEVVIPLLGEDIPVLAWGLGTGRILSSYYKITDIRDFYKNDLKQLREMKLWLK